MNNPMHRYIIGFMLSLALTAIPLLLLWWYVGAHSQYLSRDMLYAAFVLCAVAQMWVQLYFFLHLGQEATPRWRSMALYFALVVVV
ncbi:MAG TPA: cytochrome C oxidase subunit IV family protein, partial [Candidatus Paceibacterota bacterium]|nr:cytochrome C oxidase subunit IV family protein [Candidatus Paceibacterota bacterium]